MRIFNKKPIMAKKLLGDDIDAVHFDVNSGKIGHDIFVHYKDYKDDIDHFLYDDYNDALHDFKILVGLIK